MARKRKKIKIKECVNNSKIKNKYNKNTLNKSEFIELCKHIILSKQKIKIIGFN
jgi:hypothetical protein